MSESSIFCHLQCEPLMGICFYHLHCLLTLVVIYFSVFQALEKIHETFQSDMEAENHRIRQLESMAKELTDFNYYAADSINARMQVCSQVVWTYVYGYGVCARGMQRVL